MGESRPAPYNSDMSHTPWVAIQRNPMSGSGRRRPLLDFVRALRRLGLHPRLYSQRTHLDQALADPDRRAALHALVAAGGDGTVLDVLNRHPGAPIGILPLGTENLVARQFGIPRDGAAAAGIVAAGRTFPLDLGRIADRRFAIMASAGFDAAVIHDAHAARTGHIGRSHYFWPIARTSWVFGFPELLVYPDDAATPLSGRMVIAANLSSYALGLPMVPTARGDDGLLDVRIFQHRSTFHLLRDLSMVMSGLHERSAGIVRLRVHRLRIESQTPVAVQADGDPAGTTPCTLSVEPAAVQLFVPG